MPTVRIRPRRAGRVRPGLLAPVVVAIVLGILGMHGIDAHGVNLHGTVTHPDAGTPPAAGMADHLPVAVASDDAPAAGDAAMVAAGHPSSDADGMGIAMLCVAVLAGAAVTLLALLVRRARLPQVWAILEPAGRLRAAVPAVLRLGTGPPAVWRFSVIRC